MRYHVGLLITGMNASLTRYAAYQTLIYDDVMEWKCFPHNWPFVRGIHRSVSKDRQATGLDA